MAILTESTGSVLALEVNWLGSANEALLFFDGTPDQCLDVYETIDANNRRIKVRWHRVDDDIPRL